MRLQHHDETGEDYPDAIKSTYSICLTHKDRAHRLRRWKHLQAESGTAKQKHCHVPSANQIPMGLGFVMSQEKSPPSNESQLVGNALLDFSGYNKLDVRLRNVFFPTITRLQKIETSSKIQTHSNMKWNRKIKSGAFWSQEILLDRHFLYIGSFSRNIGRKMAIQNSEFPSSTP